MLLSELSPEQMVKGYFFDKAKNGFCCCFCSQLFPKGEIFPDSGRFFEASAAAERHVAQKHGGALNGLLSSLKSDSGLTENQVRLLRLIQEGLSDGEIAAQTGVSPSTVRHQKFVFRQKARQARIFLAIYALTMGVKESGESGEQSGGKNGRWGNRISPHPGATMVDDRYQITPEEKEKILSSSFFSLSPLKLKAFSPKEKKKIVVLSQISEQFQPGRRYTEAEVNAVLKDIFDDYVTLRRYLIEYGFMERTTDCREYWRKPCSTPEPVVSEPKGTSVGEQL